MIEVVFAKKEHLECFLSVKCRGLEKVREYSQQQHKVQIIRGWYFPLAETATE